MYNNEQTRDLQTDSHLSRPFNEVLKGLIQQCNNWSFMVMSTPHYDYLLCYQAAVVSFFNNTFYLFGNIHFKNENLTLGLMDKVLKINDMIKGMKNNPDLRTREYFDNVVEQCNFVHMMIMYGLNKRNMLVRMSETEPKGAASIEHWDKKTSFRKGDLKIETEIKNNKKYLVV